jgi:hypothetical protein
MAKRKRIHHQTMIYKELPKKLKIELLQLYVNSIPKRLVIHFLRCIWRQNVIAL